MADSAIPVQTTGPNLLIRVLWFLFIGWWLGQLAVLLAWLSNATILFLPFGIYLLNKLPQIFTLRMMRQTTTAKQVGGLTIVRSVAPKQRTFFARALYFVFVGSWFSLLWLELAWLLGLTIILLPLSFWMFGKAAAVTTLERMG